MTSDAVISPRAKRPRSRQYPIRCGDCGSLAVGPAVVPYVAHKSHDGRVHTLKIRRLHVLRCTNCGELLFDLDADAQISAALRAKLELLAPDEIRTRIESLGLTQKAFAARLGVAPETVSRWASGALIQTRAMDNLMRVFFDIPRVRKVLGGKSARARPAGSHR
jgi:putative zinc finger/helix-turn-helix YgiT family protein